jgi:nitrate/nitrite-specific signal transduction histidine kinase
MPFVPGIALLSAWLKQSFADKRQLLFKLGEPQAIEEARNPQTLAAMGISDQRAITSFLHNSVQSELQALLKQLQKAVRFNDPALSREVMEKLTSYINRSTRDDFELVTTNPEKRYKRLTSAWDGIIAIESSLSADFFTTNPYASIVVEIIEEFVTNAVRHSGATEVFIAGKDESKGFVLTLTRDGQPTKNGAPGVGTKLLETVSHDISETRLLDNRTQLQIKL